MSTAAATATDDATVTDEATDTADVMLSKSAH